ncbi:MAG: DegT/DnrJ/EryC1/StrS family aminotransferase [Candidatus Omnitrophota bacterium]
MFKLIPPIGTPFRIKDIIICFKLSFLKFDKLESKASGLMGKVFGVGNIYFFDSGSAGLKMALGIIKKNDNRKEVIIPAYTCRTVPQTIKSVALKPRMIDASLTDFNMDLDILEKNISDRTLAIVATHLFGTPADMERIIAIARKHGVYVIEDVAQALGAKVVNTPVGAFGDLAFYSFGKGKNLSLVSGGAVSVNNARFNSDFAKAHSKTQQPEFLKQLELFFLIIFYKIALTPSVYYFISKFKIVATSLNFRYKDREIKRLTKGQLALLVSLLDRFEGITNQRICNAKKILKCVKQTKCFRYIEDKPGNLTVYPSFPILAPTIQIRDYICNKLKKDGIGASPMYKKIADPVSKREKNDQFTNADTLFSRLFILPTIPFLNDAGILKIEKVLREVDNRYKDEYVN